MGALGHMAEGGDAVGVGGRGSHQSRTAGGGAIRRAINGLVAALVVLGGACWGISCSSGNPCREAAQRVTECTGTRGCADACAGENEGGRETLLDQCKEESRCTADCIHEASCAEIKDAFSGQPTDLSKGFLGCTMKCSSTK
jgi:hypothetical protein